MPTRGEKVKFYNPETGYRAETDVPASKTELKARGYLPEDHPNYVAPPKEDQPVAVKSTQPKPSGENAGK